MSLKIKQSTTDFSAQALARILFEHFGLADNTQFVVAYSGGCDSQVLLHGLASLRNQSNIEVIAAHFDHGLQHQSAIWSKQCERWCAEFEVGFVSVRRIINAKAKGSTEANARDARYHWLDEIAQPEQVVVSAHHADDQAETFLLNLFQGKEMEQLAGVAPARPLIHGSKNQLIRPLLGFSKAQLMRYAQLKKLTWIEDPMNHDIQFYRNYIRHELLPKLSERWPGIVSALNQAADSCRRSTERDRAKLSTWYKSNCAAQARGVFCLTEPLQIDQFLGSSAVDEQSQFEVTGLIRYWIHNAGYGSPSKGQLATLYEQIVGQRVAQATLEFKSPECLAVRYYNGHLYLTRSMQSRGCLTLPEDEPWDMQVLNIPEYGIAVEIVNGHVLKGRAVYLAWRKGGERVQLNNREHCSALKKLFQANHVPPWERDCLPFLKIDGEIVWVHGVGGVGRYAGDFGDLGVGLRFSLF